MPDAAAVAISAATSPVACTAADPASTTAVTAAPDALATAPAPEATTVSKAAAAAAATSTIATSLSIPTVAIAAIAAAAATTTITPSTIARSGSLARTRALTTTSATAAAASAAAASAAAATAFAFATTIAASAPAGISAAGPTTTTTISTHVTPVSLATLALAASRHVAARSVGRPAGGGSRGDAAARGRQLAGVAGQLKHLERWRLRRRAGRPRCGGPRVAHVQVPWARTAEGLAIFFLRLWQLGRRVVARDVAARAQRRAAADAAVGRRQRPLCTAVSVGLSTANSSLRPSTAPASPSSCDWPPPLVHLRKVGCRT